MSYKNFVKFIHSLDISRFEFARQIKISNDTIQGLYHGVTKKPQARIARKIVNASGGKLTMKDFGFAEEE